MPDKPSPPHVIEELDDIARRAPIPDVTGATLRSLFVGVLLVGGLAWLARVVVHLKRPPKRSSD